MIFQGGGGGSGPLSPSPSGFLYIINCYSLFKLYFGLSIITSFEMILRVCVCWRERERQTDREKTGRKADGFTLLIIILHKQTKISNFFKFLLRENIRAG